MADEGTIRCPLCGNEVPSGVTKCPVCATDLDKVRPRKSVDMGAAGRLPEDYLHREIPRIELPKSKLNCPLCAKELKGGESKCPRCGIPLTAQRELLECPECGAMAPVGSKTCPKCGIGFEEPGEVPPAPELLPPPIVAVPPVREPPPKEPVPQPEILTPVPVAATPEREGLVNGKGAVNGTGLSYGSRAEGIMLEPGRRRKEFITRWQVLAVLIAVAIIVPTFVYISYSQEKGPVSVDGSFGDWASAQKFGVYSTAGSAPIDVDQWAVEVQGDRVFLYVKVQADMMASTSVNSFYLFIDNDNSALTGYAVSGMGADYLVELDGWNGSVRSSAACEFPADADQYDWNSWLRLGAASASVAGDQLEASADLPDVVGASARFMLLSKDAFDRNSLSLPVPRTGGLLVIEQVQGPAVQGSGVVPTSASVAVLRLIFSCEGADGTIENIVPIIGGAVSAFSFQRIPLTADQEPKPFVDVTVDTTSSVSGSLLEAYVTAAGVTSTFANLKVIGESVRVYASAAPSTIAIDGAFADWTSRTAIDSDPLSVGNENVDIDRIGLVNNSEASSFYVSVLGDMLGGSYVPIVVSKPSGGGGGIIIPTRKTGEDVLRIYIDRDMSTGSGRLVAATSKIIGADNMIEIKGLDGEVRSKALYTWSSGQWSVLSAEVLAGSDRQQIELSVSSSSISGSSSIDYVVETTDWRGRVDVATSVPMPGRSVPYSFATSPGIETWIVDGATTSPAATAMSFQRKMFFDGTNFWVMYWDGANTILRYSADGGVTWSATTRAFSTATINEASLWFDSSSNRLYIVGDRSNPSKNVVIRRGTVDPVGHTITWSSADRQVAVSANNLGGKHAFISKDAAGYIWVMSSNLTKSTSPLEYDLSAFKSLLVDSLAAWDCMGNMLGTDSSQQNLKGSVVPAGTGSEVWCVYGYDGNVGARKYNGTWSAETTIYAIGTGNPGNTDNAPPNALVDGNGVLHVVYGNGHEQPATSKPYIYYVYCSGGVFSAPYRLDTATNSEGNLYPTLSLDSTTGKVYAFWILTDTSGAGITVMGKVNASGTWSLLSFDPQTADQKQYLTSIYSAPGEWLICWQWTQNVTAPIQVIFDKLPEFGSVVLPVLFVLMVCVAMMGRARARKN